MPSRTPVPPALTTGPFLRTDAERLGLSRRMLQGRRFRRITDNVYALAELAEQPLVRARAVQLVNPAAVLSHRTAALVWELPVQRPVHGEVTIPRGGSRIGASVVRMHETSDPSLTQRRGLTVTSPTRTFTDLSASLPLLPLVQAGDALVRRAGCSPVELIVASERSRSGGAGLARLAASYVRPGVEAPTETLVRLLLVLAGLPEPGTGCVLRDSNGRAVAWPDLDYRDFGIAVEYDGAHHFADRDQRRRDVRRNEAYRRLGWTLIVVTAERIRRYPEGVVEEVLDALKERGHPDAPQSAVPAWSLVTRPTGITEW